MKCRFCGKEMQVENTAVYRDGSKTEYKCPKCGHVAVDHRRW